MGPELYGHAVRSDFPLGRVRHGPGARGTIAVRAAAEPLGRPSGTPAVSTGDGFEVHRGGGRLTMWCAATGTYVLDPGALSVVASPAPAAGPEWEHRLACIAVPLLLAERGQLALHASAVLDDGSAVAFAGMSGRGKSTTAAALATAGYPVLAEDGCVISADAERALLWPGLRGVRIRAGGALRIVHADRDAGGAGVPLGAVVLLGPRGGAEPAVEPVAPLDALLALMPNTLHALGASQAAAFRGAAALGRAVPVLRATLPDDLAGAPGHAARLLRLVRAASRASAA